MNPEEPYAFLVEDERFDTGETGAVATIFLTNRECPWRCTMCDLWKNTLTESVLTGAIPRQIGYALARLPAARQIKLYNSGSFFDPRAIPVEDYPSIAALLRGYERVIVESHPSLIGGRCLALSKQLGDTPLEVAMGLETAHPSALEKLNKQISVEQFSRAADWLGVNSIALRTFILVQPPLVPAIEAPEWMSRSIALALACRSTVIALIPTRAGNGALDQLQADGEFVPPTLTELERAAMEGLMQAAAGGRATRIFADLWDVKRFATCQSCLLRRVERLRAMNHSQVIAARVECSDCEGSA